MATIDTCNWFLVRLLFIFYYFFFLSSGGWGKVKLQLTTLPRIFIRVVCRFNSVASLLLFFHCMPAGCDSDSTPDSSRRVRLCSRQPCGAYGAVQTATAVVSRRELVVGTGELNAV